MTTDAAPAGLELVRAFLNTWSVPNDTREPRDDLAALAAEPAAWRRALPGLEPPEPQALPQLRRLREALRAALGREHPSELQPWLQRLPLLAQLPAAGTSRPVALVPRTDSATGHLLAQAVMAVADGTWYRLRACPDCRFVFYDTSRNGGRTWCRMTRDDAGGRSCGSLAKARAKRTRDRARS